MKPFKQLNIGDRFRHNCMYFEKTDPYEVTVDGRTVSSNAKFLSDDHYESGKTDLYIGGPACWFDGNLEVKEFEGETRRERVLETAN